MAAKNANKATQSKKLAPHARHLADLPTAERLHIGFQQWLLSRIGELQEVLDQLAPDESPLNSALGPRAGAMRDKLREARDAFEEALTKSTRGNTPCFLLEA